MQEEKNTEPGLVPEKYQDRFARIKELKAEGETIIGYLCIYPVLEIITAFDMVPFRIFGDMNEPITDADDYMPAIVCPFLRCILDLGLKGRYDFLDGVVTAHICDVGARTSHLWDVAVRTSYSHFIDVPHTNHPTSMKRMKELLVDFQESLESFTGKRLLPEKLRESITKHNEQRRLVRELYNLKKLSPPLISGAETVQIIKVLMSLPVHEGNTLLNKVIEKIQKRRNTIPEKTSRLLVWGSVIDDSALIDMIEGFDASVVMDDTCVGSRAYFSDVPITDDPLDGLAYHYLEDLKCPRTFRDSTSGTVKGYEADLENRFGYLKEYIEDWDINGVILQALRYCDSHGYEIPQIKDYLDKIGVPSIYLEHDYSKAAFGPMMTRVQAFTEIIG